MSYVYERILGRERERRIHKTSTLAPKPEDQRTAADERAIDRAVAKRERRRHARTRQGPPRRVPSMTALGEGLVLAALLAVTISALYFSGA